jgi:P4 family phage/plasmid primase-like protien
MLLGDGGNGKSQFLELLTRMLGDENVATPSLQDLMEDPYAKAELYGKMANIHADLSNRKLESTGTFKMLTGGDMMRGERKYERSFKFYNYAKLIYSTNSLPDTADSTSAFWRRWKTIRFPYTFVNNPSEPLEKQKQEQIVEQICDEEAISTFFNWAVEGLVRLLDNGGFTDSRSEEQMKVMWLAQANPLRIFVDEFVEVDQGSWVSKDDFYTRYVEFCDMVGGSSLAKQNVTKQLNQMIPEIRTGRKTGDRVTAYLNINLLPFDKDKIPNFGVKTENHSRGSRGFGINYKRVRGYNLIYRKVMRKPLEPLEYQILPKITPPTNDKNQNKPRNKDIKATIQHILQEIDTTTTTEQLINAIPAPREQIEHVIDNMKRDGDIFEPKPGEIQVL